MVCRCSGDRVGRLIKIGIEFFGSADSHHLAHHIAHWNPPAVPGLPAGLLVLPGLVGGVDWLGGGEGSGVAG